ncbi:hypothetical protein BX666DRAFT_1924069 [Dichotomocladium elegans]|nr:hypothetical protein BX666DRAFT_1924069 [Dichotomocladium elegans]
MVLGEEVTNANRVKCKAIVDSYHPPLEVIYTSSEGNKRPFIIGKQVAARDPFTYHCYVDIPPSSPRFVNTVINNNEAINYSESSSVSSDKSTYNNLKPTKHSVLDFFNCIASKDAPMNKELYTFGHWNNIELFDLVKTFMPDKLIFALPHKWLIGCQRMVDLATRKLHASIAKEKSDGLCGLSSKTIGMMSRIQSRQESVAQEDVESEAGARQENRRQAQTENGLAVIVLAMKWRERSGTTLENNTILLTRIVPDRKESRQDRARDGGQDKTTLRGVGVRYSQSHSMHQFG